jgi:hypothetical protein
MDPALSYGLVEYLRTIEMMERMVGQPAVAFHTAGTRWPCTSPLVSDWAAMNLILESLSRLEALRMEFPIEKGKARISDAPGIGIEQKANLLPLCEELARG